MAKHGIPRTNLQTVVNSSTMDASDSFSIAVDHATNRLEQYLVNNMLDKDIRHRSGLNPKAELI